ncbi:kinase-like domain-containing protein, partial [Mycena leptocephala]
EILYILMEYCGGGDLSAGVRTARKEKRRIPEDEVWRYLTQILLALKYCHNPKKGESQILHRDLKPSNGECC